MSNPDDRLIDNAVRLGLAWRFARRARPTMLGDAPDGGFGPERLEPGDLETLDQIALSGEARMSELAAGLLVDPSTATRAVGRLVTRGLISRRNDPDDARASLVSLNDAGRVIQAEVFEKRTAATVTLLERFEPADREAIGRLLPLLADAVADEIGLTRVQVDGVPASDAGGRTVEIAIAVGSAWRFLRRAQTMIVAVAVGETSGPPMQSGDIDTLDEIAMAGGEAQMSQIAAGMQVDPSSATKSVSRLVERGLAVRRRDPDDGRVLQISLTEAGRTVQAAARDRRFEFAIRLLERFGPEDQTAIDRLVPAVADVIADELGLTR